MVFWRKKKKVSNIAFPFPQTDIHSHLIPAIDDGVQTIEEAVQALLTFQNLGYRKLITTPHIHYAMFPNTSELILENYHNLLNKLKQNSEIQITLEVAAEYKLDDKVLALVKENKTLLTFGKEKRFLLFEMGFNIPSALLQEFAAALHKRNIIPVLAHPERYSYLWKNIKLLKQWKRWGLLYQINIRAFTKDYEKETYKTALTIAKEGLISFLGSDAHSPKHIEAIAKLRKDKTLLNLIFNNNILLNDEL